MNSPTKSPTISLMTGDYSYLEIYINGVCASLGVCTIPIEQPEDSFVKEESNGGLNIRLEEQ
uniref:Uncharacterized protein n=1 Tax=Nelumbo nucifera TaxID=4432 RepID=A0A822ZJZ8_NELNU|nr:TPA_asm: hypothetical protein HUJ06_016361 [Nelumbo nucifera]